MTSVRAEAIDSLIRDALTSLAGDPHVRNWPAKKHNWVNYFVFRHLLSSSRLHDVISDPAQIAIECPVPQPPGYKTKTVRRDLVIWRTAGCSAWDAKWKPTCHPLAILEWTVHRPGHPKPNREVEYERKWLEDYCRQRPREVVGYAIEVDAQENPTIVRCFRCLGDRADWRKPPWLERPCE